MSCIVNTKLWLLIHLIVVKFIELSIYYTEIIFPFLSVIILFSSRRWNGIRIIIMDNDWLNPYVQEGNPYFILLKQEIKLILIYVCFSIVYKWLQFSNSNYTITLLNILRWLIEASNVPLPLLYTIIFSQSHFIENFFKYYEFFYVLIIILKLPLFFMMRYAESDSDYIVNDLQMFLLNKFCKTS
jgi:hypothetical protein